MHSQKIVPHWHGTICGDNLFHNETMDGKNDPSYTFTRSNIGLKHKLAFRGFEGNKDGVTNL